MSDLDVYVNGEPVIIRGAEREVATTVGRSPTEFVDVWLHVDYVNSPNRRTTPVNISSVKCDGGFAALTDHLRARGLVPEWWDENDPVPDRLD